MAPARCAAHLRSQSRARRFEAAETPQHGTSRARDLPPRHPGAPGERCPAADSRAPPRSPSRRRAPAPPREGTVSSGCPPCPSPSHPAQGLTTGPASRASSKHSRRAPAGRRRRALRRHRAAAIAAGTARATSARLMGTARSPPPPGPRGCGRGGVERLSTARHSSARLGTARHGSSVLRVRAGTLRRTGVGPHGRVSAAGHSPHTRIGQSQSPSRGFLGGLGIPCWC